MGDFLAFGGRLPLLNNDVIFIKRSGWLTENLSCYVNWLEGLSAERLCNIINTFRVSAEML